jgi:PAS domain-containing protein
MTGLIGNVTEELVGGRVLIVVPAGSGNGPDDGSFVRGGDVSGVGSGGGGSAVGDAPGGDGGAGATPADSESDASAVDSGGPAEPPGAPSGGEGGDCDCDPEAVAAGIEDRLRADVVLRDERTAEEYLQDLGPTIDCVVVLGQDVGPLGRLADDTSIPAVVCERPVVETDAAAERGAIPIGVLTDRVRAAVRAARRRSALEEQNTQLTALSHYARDITGCENAEDVLDRTVEAATDALAFDYCVILLVEGDQLMPRASTLPDHGLSPKKVSEGIAGRTLANGEAEIVADMQSDPDAVPEHDDLHAVLSVPIGSRGVFQVASHSRDAFDERDKEFAEILAGYTREALARLEREVTLRAERDRLYAFYTATPIPILCVERRAGELTVTDANDTYEATFGGSLAGRPLSAVVPTEAERERYEAVLNGAETSRGTAVRRIDDREREIPLTIIPVSPPNGPAYAFGVYRTEQADGDGPD